MFVKVLELFLLFQFLFSTTKAYQRCDTSFENVDLICYDSYSSVGYCCENDYGGIEHVDCCYYQQVWALWYFWFGLVLFLLLIGVVIGVCKKCTEKKNRRNTSNSHQMSNVNSLSGNAVVPQATPVFADVPPTYYQVQAQGISDQYKDFSNYGEPVVPSIPPGVEPTPLPTYPDNSQASPQTSQTPI